jgi:superfamily II DNA or RNA helicase
MQLICSPKLSEQDYEAIQKGYSDRRQLLEILKKDLNQPQNVFEQDRLNLLAYLIKAGILDIKVAFTLSDMGIGIYHEKMGILQDEYDNTIAFSGSLNESKTAFTLNYETIDVYCSWKNEYEASRVDSKLFAFEAIWSNLEPNMETIHVPELKDEIIERYLVSEPNRYIDIQEFGLKPSYYSASNSNKVAEVQIPYDVNLYDYQLSAIDTWIERDFRGIFDMATGTGKTYTALGSIVRFFEHCDGVGIVVVVCPFQHLVEQWVEDIQAFGIAPIIGYSRSSQRNWKKVLPTAIRDQRLKIKGKEFLCFITTNATFRTEFTQSQLRKIRGDALLIVDEAHNFGAETLRSLLPSNFGYRLGLSATIERHKDEEGTAALFEYFGEKCIEYTLERAIAEGKLTNYYYKPLLVTLIDIENEKYKEISLEISRCFVTDRNGNRKLSKRGKFLAIQRARIIAGAKNKIDILRESMHPYSEANHILVYCGAASIMEPDEDATIIDSDELRQINQVTDLLGNELNMRVSQFTSKEDIDERKVLKKQFELGEYLQVLIAIKCLDEGVNIPKIKTAFILASTTNPKEYIQRRGRVLRLASGKTHSTIYDFFTVPFSVDEVTSMPSAELEPYRSLVRNELARGYEFSKIALNRFEAESFLRDLGDAYGISEFYFDEGA